ncbi:CGNR zinc finger domain-containing protein [Longispora sp. K20-0274]|uniref:CGNR zinc finger domain-containing protein n=1 Tax=Longispora sp. K20-0274 TaxID=3088255 RepID=UPI00399AB8F7
MRDTVPASPTPAATWVLPDEPVPIRLMNTVWADRHGVHDALTSRDDLRAWLAHTGLGPAGTAVTDGDVTAHRALRDALRRLAALLTDDTRPAAASATTDLDRAVADVNAAAATSPPVPGLRLRDGTLHRTDTTTGPTPAAALSTVATAAVDLLTSATARDLRACHAPGCVLYFLKDHPRREWCSTACGNRARAARHYRKHRDTP